MWFDFKSISMGEDEEELSKEITILQAFKSQIPNLYPPRDLLFLVKISSYIFS